MDFEEVENAFLQVGDNRHIQCRNINNYSKRNNQSENFERTCKTQKRQEQAHKDKQWTNDLEREKQFKKVQQFGRKLKLMERHIEKQVELKKGDKKIQPKHKSKLRHQIVE
ncbi:unnamed protein product [Paramecium octaurelia]|uniref:Uncharacterized protein n=1 Tax=Paramecium octaurelia TaxID=43137 RepID=A0A8S1Y5C9_PAROT|nr:unnamed protein product [Paramecium octaurelia]